MQTHGTAAISKKLMTIFILKERVISVFNTENDVSAVSAVTAVGTAVGNVFFSVEADSAVSAVARLHVYSYVICNHEYHLIRL